MTEVKMTKKCVYEKVRKGGRRGYRPSVGEMGFVHDLAGAGEVRCVEERTASGRVHIRCYRSDPAKTAVIA